MITKRKLFFRFFNGPEIGSSFFISINSNIPLEKITSFEAELHEYLHNHHAKFLDEINQQCNYNDEIAAQMKEIVEKFKSIATSV